MQEENNMADGAAKGKNMSISKKGMAWYTLFSFLLVTLMIFIAVMVTYSGAEKRLGATYSKQIALFSLGFTEDEVSNICADKTYYNGAEAFKVSVTRDGVEHIVYVDTANAKVCAPKTEQIAAGDK